MFFNHYTTTTNSERQPGCMATHQLLQGLCICLLLCLSSATAAEVDRVVVVALFNGKAMLEIDGQQQLLRDGQTSPEGVKLIKATSEEATLEIAGQQQTYQLGTHINSEYKPRESGRLVQVWPDTNGMYRVDGSINGFAMKFLVDTGATSIAINRNEARRLGINYKLDGRKGMAQTASGLETMYMVTLDRVRIGEIELRNVEASVIDGDYPATALLGNSFLGRLNLNREASVLELREKPR